MINVIDTSQSLRIRKLQSQLCESCNFRKRTQVEPATNAGDPDNFDKLSDLSGYLEKRGLNNRTFGGSGSDDFPTNRPLLLLLTGKIGPVRLTLTHEVN